MEIHQEDLQANWRLLSNGEQFFRKLFDVSPYAIGSWFGELKEENYFRTVRLLPDGTGVEWDNGQDIAPHELYDSSTPIA